MSFGGRRVSLKWFKMSENVLALTGKSSSNNYDVVDSRLIPRCHHADLLRPRLDLVLCHSLQLELPVKDLQAGHERREGHYVDHDSRVKKCRSKLN